MEKITLEKIIKYNNGLNIIANAGVGIKDVEVAFGISVFKAESEKLVKAMQEAGEASKSEGKEKEAEIKVLLEKEYEMDVPVLTLAMFKESTKEIPLAAFDYLHEFMKK